MRSGWPGEAETRRLLFAEPAPTVTTLGAPTAGAGKCMVPTAELLGTQTLAVDGTVTDLTDGVATLEVTRWYAGEPTDLLRVEARPRTSPTWSGPCTSRRASGISSPAPRTGWPRAG